MNTNGTSNCRSNLSEVASSAWQPCLAELSVGLQTEIHVNTVEPAIQVRSTPPSSLRRFLFFIRTDVVPFPVSWIRITKTVQWTTHFPVTFQNVMDAVWSCGHVFLTWAVVFFILPSYPQKVSLRLNNPLTTVNDRLFSVVRHQMTTPSPRSTAGGGGGGGGLPANLWPRVRNPLVWFLVPSDLDRIWPSFYRFYWGWTEFLPSFSMYCRFWPDDGWVWSALTWLYQGFVACL